MDIVVLNDLGPIFLTWSRATWPPNFRTRRKKYFLNEILHYAC
jgi:hypothetical protein